MQERLMKHELGEDFVRVVEAAAIAAARTRGRGDRHACDLAAVEAMQRVIETVPMRGRIRISEGERDGAPMLPIGARVGLGWQYPEGNGRYPVVDIAVDSLEGTNLCALGKAGAIAIMACAEEGGLMTGPDCYMEKWVGGPAVRGKISLDYSVEENIEITAAALKRPKRDLNFGVLDRIRHEELISRVRATGASVTLIDDGDLAISIFMAMSGSNLHGVVGYGGAPEGIIAAVGMKCLNGEMQGRFILKEQLEVKEDRDKISDDIAYRMESMGIIPGHIYERDELAPGNQLVLAATAVTRWRKFEEVKFFAGGISCQSLILSTDPEVGKQIREIKTTYLEDDPDLVYRLS